MVGVGVFEVFTDMEREGQDWTKTRKRLIVETLSTSLIQRCSSSAGRAVNTRNGARKTANNDGPLKDLRGIKQLPGIRTTHRRQDALLLLCRIGDVRVEGNGQQRMIIEHSSSRTNNSFCV